MKNDTTTTVLNFILAALVIMGVLFAALMIMRQRSLNQMMPELQARTQMVQVNMPQVGALLNEVKTYNAKVQSPDLERILQAASRPAPPAK